MEPTSPQLHISDEWTGASPAPSQLINKKMHRALLDGHEQLAGMLPPAISIYIYIYSILFRMIELSRDFLDEFRCSLWLSTSLNIKSAWDSCCKISHFSRPHPTLSDLAPGCIIIQIQIRKSRARCPKYVPMCIDIYIYIYIYMMYIFHMVDVNLSGASNSF